MNNFIDELKMTEFVKKYPMIASKPKLFPIIALLMAHNPEQYRVRLYDGKISILKEEA